MEVAEVEGGGGQGSDGDIEEETDAPGISGANNPSFLFSDQTFVVAENSVAGTIIDHELGGNEFIVTGDQGSSLTFQIVSNLDPNGNLVPAFRIENGRQLVGNDPRRFRF